VKAIKESFIVEGAVNFYQHFNFTAMQGSTIHLFFAEVIPDGESCDVSCCRLLQDNDNGMIGSNRNTLIFIQFYTEIDVYRNYIYNCYLLLI